MKKNEYAMINLISAAGQPVYFCSMFKPVTALMILMAFMAQTFSGPFILLDYMANTASYAKNCINKAKPKLHCNGKCQVMKKMQEEEKKEQQDNEQRTANKIQVLSSKSFFSPLVIPLRTSIKLTAFDPISFPVDRSLAVFHPPQV